MRGLLLITNFLILLCAMSIGVQAQFNCCLQKSELLQLQSFDLTNVSSMMRTKGWKFDGVKEYSSPNDSRSQSINQAVIWGCPNGNSIFNYYENDDMANFIIAHLSQECYSSLLQTFSEKQNGFTSVLEGGLVTKFSSNEVCIEFVERPKKDFEVRLFARRDEGSFYKLFSGQGSLLSENQNEQRYSEPVSASFEMKGRVPIENPIPAYRCRANGVVAVLVSIDELGQVVDASIQEGSSSLNSCLREESVSYARKWRFDFTSSKSIQQGRITFVFEKI